MAEHSAESRRAQRVLDDAAGQMVGTLARQIAFSREPKAALGPCRKAVSVACYR